MVRFSTDRAAIANDDGVCRKFIQRCGVDLPEPDQPKRTAVSLSRSTIGALANFNGDKALSRSFDLQDIHSISDLVFCRLQKNEILVNVISHNCAK
jgi:hypothetical protein